MSGDGSSRAERVSRARELIGLCGIREELGDEEAIRRADEIAAAASHYAEASGAVNATVLDEHLRDEFELHDADATMATMTAALSTRTE
jgi:hypothetical protein